MSSIVFQICFFNRDPDMFFLSRSRYVLSIAIQICFIYCDPDMFVYQDPDMFCISCSILIWSICGLSGCFTITMMDFDGFQVVHSYHLGSDKLIKCSKS